MSEPTVLSDASSPDVIIVGSGMGGATLAAGLRADWRPHRHSRTRRTAERYARNARRTGHLSTWILSPNRDLDRRSGSTVQPRQLLLCRWKQQVLRCGSDPIPRVRLPADYSRRREDPRLAVRLRRVGALVYKGRELVSRLRRTRRRPHRNHAIPHPILCRPSPTNRLSRQPANDCGERGCTRRRYRSVSTSVPG